MLSITSEVETVDKEEGILLGGILELAIVDPEGTPSLSDCKLTTIPSSGLPYFLIFSVTGIV